MVLSKKKGCRRYWKKTVLYFLVFSVVVDRINIRKEQILFFPLYFSRVEFISFDFYFLWKNAWSLQQNISHQRTHLSHLRHFSRGHLQNTKKFTQRIYCRLYSESRIPIDGRRIAHYDSRCVTISTTFDDEWYFQIHENQLSKRKIRFFVGIMLYKSISPFTPLHIQNADYFYKKKLK